MGGALVIDEKEAGMKLNENQKITLTIGHIKKLVKESKNVGDSEWFRRDVERIVSEEFHANIYDLKCYYDGDDSFITRRDFVIEGRFGYREDRRYSAEKNRLYAAIRKAGGTNIIGRVFNNGGFDVAFDIQEKKLAEYRAKEEKWQAEQDSEKAAEMDIIRQEVESFDISKYKPNEKILDKIKAYKDKGSKVNVKAISGYEKLLTYYWAAAILGWDDLMNDIKRKLMSEDFYRLGKVEGDSGSGVYMFKFPELSVIDKLQKRFKQLKWLWGEGSPDGEFILGILNKIRQETMKKMNEDAKVTLTLGQLKKLVKESNFGSDWHWVVKEGEQSNLRGEWIVEQLILHDNNVFKVMTEWEGWWVVCRHQDGLASGLAEILAIDYGINGDDAKEEIRSEDIEDIYNGTVTTAADGCLSIEKCR